MEIDGFLWLSGGADHGAADEASLQLLCSSFGSSVILRRYKRRRILIIIFSVVFWILILGFSWPTSVDNRVMTRMFDSAYQIARVQNQKHTSHPPLLPARRAQEQAWS
jgi:hypothetical protein